MAGEFKKIPAIGREFYASGACNVKEIYNFGNPIVPFDLIRGRKMLRQYSSVKGIDFEWKSRIRDFDRLVFLGELAKPNSYGGRPNI